LLFEIISLGILGCFLYYYRPRNLMRETKFKQVLRWSEFGKLLFIGESLFMIGITYVPLVQMALEGRLQIWMENHDIFLYPFSYLWSTDDAVLVIAFIFLPFFFAWLTQWKLVKPLSEEKVPSQKWFNLLFVIGLSFVISIEVYIIVKPWLDYLSSIKYFYEFGRLPLLIYTPEMLLSNILGATLFFSSLIVGTLCVAIAKHKSKKSCEELS